MIVSYAGREPLTITAELLLEVFDHAGRMRDEEGVPQMSVKDLVDSLVANWDTTGDAKLKAAVRRQAGKMAGEGILEEIDLGKRAKAFRKVPGKEEAAAESDGLEAAFDGPALAQVVSIAPKPLPKAAAVQPETPKIAPMTITPAAAVLFDRTVSVAFDETAFWQLCCTPQGRDYGGPTDRRLQLMGEISKAGGALERKWTKREFRLLTVMHNFRMVLVGKATDDLQCAVKLLDGGRCAMANEGMTFAEMFEKAGMKR